MNKNEIDDSMIFYGIASEPIIGHIPFEPSNNLGNDDCKSDCYWNFKGTCVSDELDEEYNAKQMTLDNNCPCYLHPDLEETADMRAYIRKNISKIGEGEIEEIYDLLKEFNLQRI